MGEKIGQRHRYSTYSSENFEQVARNSVYRIQALPCMSCILGGGVEELTISSGLETRFWVYVDLCYGLTTYGSGFVQF